MQRKFWIMLMLTSLSVYADKKKMMYTQNMDPVDVSKWGLPTDEKYPGIMELNNWDFEKKVLEGKDSWVVIVHDGKIKGKWVSLSNRLLGSVWFGSINFKTKKTLAIKWAEDIQEDDVTKGNVAIVFPFGKSKKERLKYSRVQWPKLAKTPTEAEKLFASSYPKIGNQFSFKADNMKAFQEWVIEAYYQSEPPKFPILCISDKPYPNVPSTLLSVSSYFSDFFEFAMVRKENIGDFRRQFKEYPIPDEFPQYVMLLGLEPSKEEMDKGSFGLHFNLLPFLPKKYGNIEHFTSIVKFLFTANEDYRDKLPGRPNEESTAITSLATVRQALKKRVRDINKHYNKDEL